MRFHWRLAAAVAGAIFLAMFFFRLTVDQRETGPANNSFGVSQSFELAKNNYATLPKLVGPSGQSVGDSQKYEKVATLTELTRNYDADRKRIDDLLTSHQGIVQFERAIGLVERRTLYLGVGVPPEVKA